MFSRGTRHAAVSRVFPECRPLAVSTVNAGAGVERTRVHDSRATVVRDAAKWPTDFSRKTMVQVHYRMCSRTSKTLDHIIRN